MNKVLGVAAFVFVVIVGLAFTLHGNARYAEGVASANAAHSNAGVEAAENSRKNLEKTQRETNFMSDTDIDADLYKLGIMRSESDY